MRRAAVPRPDEDVVALTRPDGNGRLVSWSASLNIYRVNRFHPIDLDEGRKKRRWLKEEEEADARVDLVEQLLMRNMVEAVEAIFGHVGLEAMQECLLVCRLWHDFLSTHVFKRWAEAAVDRDQALRELSQAQGWDRHLNVPSHQVEDFLIYRKICFRIFDLREVWRYREPKLRRLNCDSFVLSLKFCGESLYCGLNNGCLQLWDLDWSAKKREQEIHDKGVKCLDVGEVLFATGSYDRTAKVWRRDTWECLHVLAMHQDSVWDLRLKGDCRLVTAGLDGAVAMFEVWQEEEEEEEQREQGAEDMGALTGARPKRRAAATGGGEKRLRSTLETLFIMQAHDDLVSAVDFDSFHLVAGYEDSQIGVWSLPRDLDGGRRQDVSPVLLRRLGGHAEGVTGLRLGPQGRGRLLVSGSYDGTVRLWNLEAAQCLLVLGDAQHFVRCVSLSGSVVAAGDFGGFVHVWDVRGLHGACAEGAPSASIENRVTVRHHRHFKAHSGHVVTVQVSARRVVSGARDKTALIQDFWQKMLDVTAAGESGRGRRRRRKEEEEDPAGERDSWRQSRFLKGGGYNTGGSSSAVTRRRRHY